MNLDPFGDGFRRSSRFGGNIFLLVFFAFTAIAIAIFVIHDMAYRP